MVRDRRCPLPWHVGSGPKLAAPEHKRVAPRVLGLLSHGQARPAIGFWSTSAGILLVPLRRLRADPIATSEVAGESPAQSGLHVSGKSTSDSRTLATGSPPVPGLPFHRADCRGLRFLPPQFRARQASSVASERPTQTTDPCFRSACGPAASRKSELSDCVKSQFANVAIPFDMFAFWMNLMQGLLGRLAWRFPSLRRA